MTSILEGRSRAMTIRCMATKSAGTTTTMDQSTPFNDISSVLGDILSSPVKQKSNRNAPTSQPGHFDTSSFGGFMDRPKVKSSPFTTYSGRTKPVIDGDVAGAFRSLNTTLRNNMVAKEYRTQKFYEKPSDKRVRLNRERHRKRFLSGVKRLVNLVKEQRKFL